MDKQLLFIHSAGAQGEGKGSAGLLAYLRESLAGYTIFSPSMPMPENPRYEEWKAVLKKEISRLHSGAVLVGHSMGGSALLKYFLEEDVEGEFQALITVAAPFWGVEEDWGKEDFTINRNRASWNLELPRIVLIHCINDGVVPFSHFERYADILPAAEAKGIAGEDHLFQDGLLELLDAIRELH